MKQVSELAQAKKEQVKDELMEQNSCEIPLFLHRLNDG